jgi:hypothetical protein
LGLESENVGLGNVDLAKLRDRLERNGATEEEIEFLLSGRRVELNAMTSAEFVAFVERKLEENGVCKVVPDKQRLVKAYQLFAQGRRVRKAVKTVLETMGGDAEIATPDDLERRVREYLEQNPESPWDEAVRHVAADLAEDDDDE